MKLSSRAHDLFQAFDQPGCPVCRLALDSVHHYLDSLVYEYVNKPSTHEAVRAAWGFCPAHAWHVEDEINASAFGIAVLYEGVVRNLIRDAGSASPKKAASALKPSGPCPACKHQQTIEEHLIRNLMEHLSQDEFAEGFRKSAGLCVPHLRLALAAPGGSKERLLAIQREIWSGLLAELGEFIRKHDYRFTIEEMGEEGSSPRRAIEGTAGQKGLL